MLIHETINAKDVQMSDAVQYCQDNNCRGYAALQTGRFPLIKDPRTVNKRLDGYSKAHQDNLRILTCNLFAKQCAKIDKLGSTAAEQVSVMIGLTRGFVNTLLKAVTGLRKSQYNGMFDSKGIDGQNKVLI